MSDQDLAAAVVVVVLNVKNKRKRRWAKEWFKKRQKYTHEHLLRDLASTEVKDFKNFVRLDLATFQELLVMVTPLIEKKNTNMREAIPPFQRLSITLRYLATGNTLEDLKFYSAISPQSLSLIIMDTCDNTSFKAFNQEHSKSTVLDLVGLQIWRGALLLGDWLLHNGHTFNNDFYFLELGSGVGLSSIVAAMFAPVYCTDVNKGGLLQLVRSNITRNKHLINYPINVVELDFLSQTLPQEIVKIVPSTPIILAADVIYDDVITEAFTKTVQHLLAKPPQRSAYVALEKRYVFTIEDCDAVAPCYEFYLDCLKKFKNIKVEEVSIDFPQYFQYDRVKELVLWKLTSVF